MLSGAFFERFGMLVIDDFLDRETCARLVRAARSANTKAAEVWSEGETRVDREARRTARANVSRAVRDDVERRLLAIKPRVERHFRVRLNGLQAPQFLIYRRGDFFECHTDDGQERGTPGYLRRRRISVVISLGRDGTKRPSSTGGALVFPGLFDDPRLRGREFAPIRRPGQLIAFRAGVVHGVSPVVRGSRFTIVGWYC
jgi:predicted 2-oxoglutarate/Fe(II)-dependent dioxygenase YbiX